MKYFALLTKLGESLLAQATALGTKLELTHMAVGDGGGSLPTPDTNQTKLVKEQRRAAINTLFIDEKNPNQIIAEQIIPESEGGWFIREIGLFDKAGNLIAVANCPETYKPQLTEGSGRTQAIRMVLIVSHTESVTLKIDPSVVLATREYVDDSVKNAIEVHAKSRKHPDASTSAKGFVQLSDVLSTDNSKAITPKLATEINQRAISAQASANAANTAATNANNNANGRVPSGRKINNKSLVADISLTAGDVGAYTKTETDSKVADAKKTGVDAQVTANAANTAATNANNNANGRVPNSRKVNNKPLSNDINLTASDVGAQPKGDYATKTELNNGLGEKFDKAGGAVTGSITLGGNLTSGGGVVQINNEKTGSAIQLDGAINGTARINSKRNNGQWRNHVLPDNNGTLMQIGDFGFGGESYFSKINKLSPSANEIRTFDSSITNAINKNLIGLSLSWASAGAGRSVRVIACEGGSSPYPDWYGLTYTSSGPAPYTQKFYTTANTTEDRNGNLKVSGADSLSDCPVGVPLPWPQSTAPSGFLVCNGQSFNKTTYPLLAAAYPSGVLPDLRGEFIRGLDAGRGVDNARSVLSAQSDAMRNFTGTLKGAAGRYDPDYVTGVFKLENTDAQGSGFGGYREMGKVSMDPSRQVPTANENRPRNIAFLYIVRAA